MTPLDPGEDYENNINGVVKYYVSFKNENSNFPYLTETDAVVDCSRTFLKFDRVI